MGDALISGRKAWDNIAFKPYSLEDVPRRVGWKNNAPGVVL